MNPTVNINLTVKLMQKKNAMAVRFSQFKKKTLLENKKILYSTFKMLSKQ